MKTQPQALEVRDYGTPGLTAIIRLQPAYNRLRYIRASMDAGEKQAKELMARVRAFFAEHDLTLNKEGEATLVHGPHYLFLHLEADLRKDTDLEAVKHVLEHGNRFTAEYLSGLTEEIYGAQ